MEQMRRWVLLLALSLLPLAAADMTKLQIKVTNEDGKPVDRASIIVKFVQGRSKIKMTKIRKEWNLKSSQEGWAKIPSIPQGKILIQVIAKNYQTFGETFDVDEEERTIEVKLKPPQQQYSAH
jgi:Carboxypeptidase regulatory-like domain